MKESFGTRAKPTALCTCRLPCAQLRAGSPSKVGNLAQALPRTGLSAQVWGYKRLKHSLVPACQRRSGTQEAAFTGNGLAKPGFWSLPFLAHPASSPSVSCSKEPLLHSRSTCYAHVTQLRMMLELSWNGYFKNHSKTAYLFVQACHYVVQCINCSVLCTETLFHVHCVQCVFNMRRCRTELNNPEIYQVYETDDQRTHAPHLGVDVWCASAA